MEYSIVTGYSLGELVQKVTDAIALGWTPIGGVCELTGTNQLQFAQAVTK